MNGFIIKIIKCEDPKLWYHQRVGEEFTILSVVNPGREHRILLNGKHTRKDWHLASHYLTHNNLLLRAQDCKILKMLP